MVTAVTVPTAFVVTVNVAVVAPAATVTLAGTCTAVVLLLDKVTLAPPVGAAPLSVTVPVDEAPPVTLAGFTETEDKDGPDDVPAAFNATMAASQPPVPSVQLVLYEPVALTMRYAGMILLTLAASVSAENELVGPPVVAPTLVSAAAATIKSLALFVTTVGVVGVVVVPAVVTGATSRAAEVATPENSLTLIPPLPVALT